MREVMERHSLAHADTLAVSPWNIESAGVANRPSDLNSLQRLQNHDRGWHSRMRRKPAESAAVSPCAVEKSCRRAWNAFLGESVEPRRVPGLSGTPSATSSCHGFDPTGCRDASWRRYLMERLNLERDRPTQAEPTDATRQKRFVRSALAGCGHARAMDPDSCRFGCADRGHCMAQGSISRR